jgi:hypothetical protein
MLLTEPGCLFEGVSQLKDGEIFLIAAGYLQPNRKPFRSETRGH